MQVLARRFAAAALVLALLRSVVSVYFSADLVRVPPSSAVVAPRLASRVVLIVVDGLRYDTALTTGDMPALVERSKRGASGLSLATPVTMTSIGVRAIGTGSTPGLNEVIRHIELPPVDFDNPVERIVERGGRVALTGDRPAWMGQFGRFIAIDETASFRAQALLFTDNVDGPDRLWTEKAVALMGRDDWELAIVMLGGIDHASHRFGPKSERFRQKAHRTDDDLRRILDAAGDDTTVLLTSDHGTADSGHHGSGEPIARQCPIVILGPHVRPGVHLDVRQTDLAATLAVLLGVPIPAESEGRAIVEALDVDEPTRHAIEAENLRQQRTYAEAYAKTHQVEPPVLTTLEALSDWLAAQRTRASGVPLLWALALGCVALSLSTSRRIDRAWWAIGLVSLGLTGGGSALLALGLSVYACWRDRCELPRPRWLAPVALAEALVAAWRLHHRAVELVTLRLLHPGWPLSAPWVALAAGLLLLGRWLRPPLLVALVLVAACGDTLALPLGIGVVFAVVLFESRGADRAFVLAAMTAALLAAAESSAWTRLHLELVAPLGLAAAAWATTERPKLRAPLLVLASLATAVLALGVPPLGLRLFVGASLVLVPGLALRLDGETAREWMAWAASIGLSLLSTSAQAPSVLCWTLAAHAVGRLPIVRQGGVFVATFASIGVRLGFLALFEGGFTIDQLEISVGYFGNPGTEHLFGTLLVVTKLLLPLFVSLLFVTLEMAGDARRAVERAVVAFWLLRILHVVASMTVARGTFYSPWVDAGHLLFGFLLAIGSGLVLAAIAGLERLRGYVQRLPR